MHRDGSYEVKVLTEQQEVEFLSLGQALLGDIGPEAYSEFVLSLTEEYEDMIRSAQPDCLAIRQLDEHRRKKEQGFE